MVKHRFSSHLGAWAQRRQLWLEYGGLALLIMLPLLKPGYILTFDMSWGPHISGVDFTSNTWLLQQTIKLCSAVVPGWIVQKLILLLIFTLAGVGAHKLASTSKLLRQFPTAAYLAGIFYVINPFMYTRFVAGQWLVMCGYALLPWALRALWDLMERPTKRTCVRALLWVAVIGLTSIHTVGIVAAAALVFFAVQGKRGLKRRGLMSGAAAGGAVIINSFWLIPAFSGHSQLAGQISSFSHSQLYAFQTAGTLFHNPLLSALTLEGFWADGQHRYIVPSHAGWLWGIAIILLGALILAGIWIAWRHKDKLGISLFVLGILSLVLGMGVAASWTAPLTEFLVAHVPFYQGYREPHKWLMLLALAYAYFATLGVALLLGATKKWPQIKTTLQGIALLLPIMASGVLLFGAHGQLRAAEYPRGWTQAKTVLNGAGPQENVLVLPWHMYLPMRFAGRVVANPADDYFSNNMITGNDPQLRGVAPQSRQDASSALYSEFVLGRDTQSLARHDVQYVLLLKEADWQSYAWVQQQPGLRRIIDTMDLQLYEVAD